VLLTRRADTIPRYRSGKAADRVSAPTRPVTDGPGLHNADSPKTVAMTILPTQGRAARFGARR
jgi:hypothetical protein